MNPVTARDAAVGRDAEAPHEIPWQGWWQVLKRVWKEYNEDQIGFVSASVAFYLMLGFVPLVGAIVAIYGWVANPADVYNQTAQLKGILPAEVLEIVQTQMTRLVQSQSAGVASIVSLALALWGGSMAMDALMTGLNICYDEREKRNWFKRKLISLALTLASAVVFAATAAAGVVLPLVLEFAHLSLQSENVLRVATGVAAPVLFLIWASLLYRFGPCRSQAKWRWITWGAAIAAIAWLALSTLFSFYVANLGNYESSYGPLGAIVILLLWFYFTGQVLLFGAEFDAELERQTAVDSTTGKPKPMGERGAFVADHLPDETAGAPTRLSEAATVHEEPADHPDPNRFRWLRDCFAALILWAMVRKHRRERP